MLSTRICIFRSESAVVCCTRNCSNWRRIFCPSSRIFSTSVRASERLRRNRGVPSSTTSPLWWHTSSMREVMGDRMISSLAATTCPEVVMLVSTVPRSTRLHCRVSASTLAPSSLFTIHPTTITATIAAVICVMRRIHLRRMTSRGNCLSILFCLYYSSVSLFSIMSQRACQRCNILIIIENSVFQYVRIRTLVRFHRTRNGHNVSGERGTPRRRKA